MKNKLTERQLRRLVRLSILQEFRVVRQRRFDPTVCDRVDLPNSMFKTSGGRAAIRKAEQTAALAAQLYGVPGVFCNVISAIFGDNKDFTPNDPNRSSSRDRQRTSSGVSQIFVGEKSDALKNKTKFVKVMIDKRKDSDSNKENAVEQARNKYDTMRRQINNARSERTAEKTVKKIISSDILNLPNKGCIKNVKKISKDDGNQSSAKTLAVSEALELLRVVTNENLINLAGEYRTVPGYTAFVEQTSI